MPPHDALHLRAHLAPSRSSSTDLNAPATLTPPSPAPCPPRYSPFVCAYELTANSEVESILGLWRQDNPEVGKSGDYCRAFPDSWEATAHFENYDSYASTIFE